MSKKLVFVFIVFSILPAVYFRIDEWLDGKYDSWFPFFESMVLNSIISVVVTLSIAWVILNVLSILNRRLPWEDQLLMRLMAEITITFPISLFLGFVFGHLTYLTGINDVPDYHQFIFQFLSIAAVLNLVLVAISDWFYFFEKWKESLVENERKLKENERLEKEKVIAQYEVLKNQINPHFLFNSLNTLSSLVHTDPQKAEEFIDEFSELYRYILDHNQKELVSLENEISIVRSYLFLQEIRFNKKVSHTISLNLEDLSECYIFPLSLQTTIENAFKHNAFTKEEPLVINIFNENDSIFIKNNLKEKLHGIKSTGIGTNNLIQRYAPYNLTPEFSKTEKHYIAKLPIIFRNSDTN